MTLTIPQVEANQVAAEAEASAQMLLAQGRHAEAERVVGAAVRLLEQGDQLGLLAQALTMQSVALARMDQPAQARRTLERALTIAEQTGDRKRAGLAALVVVEELGARLPAPELSAAYERAADLLTGTQDALLLTRLSIAARLVLQQVTLLREGGDWVGYSLRAEVRRYEEHMIRRALKESGGAVSPAARLLGFRYHQSLVSLLNTRFKHLLRERLPVKLRRKRVKATIRCKRTDKRNNMRTP